MLKWRSFARATVTRSYDDAHPNPEVDLFLKDTRGKTYEARSKLISLIRAANPKRILIVGRPGSGKSYLLNWLHNVLASDLEQEISSYEAPKPKSDGTFQDGAVFEPAPTTIVPILVRLKAFSVDPSTGISPSVVFEQSIKEQLSRIGIGIEIDKLLELTCRFVILIDELDEMVISTTSVNLREVGRFIERVLDYPNVQVVMAGRRIAADRFIPNYQTLEVQNLHESELNAIFDNASSSSQDLITYLDKWKGLKEFVATPYFALETVVFWREAGESDFNLGRLLYHLISNLIYRQRKTEYVDQIEAKMRKRLASVERLAFSSLETNGRLSSTAIQEEMNSIDDRELEEWLHLMEFVARSTSESYWKNKWVHAYFAAQYLRNYENAPTKEAQVELIQKCQPTVTLYATILLLQDMLGEDYSADLGDFVSTLDRKISERERNLITWAFESAVTEFVKTIQEFDDVQISYQPLYLGDGEIDVYATRRRNNVREIWIVECKFRFPPYPCRLKQEHIDQLLKYKKQIYERESRIAREEGKALKLIAILATNGRQINEDAYKLARTYDIEIWDFDLPPEKFTRRTKLNTNQRERICADKRASKYS